MIILWIRIGGEVLQTILEKNKKDLKHQNNIALFLPRKANLYLIREHQDRGTCNRMRNTMMFLLLSSEI